MRFKGSLLAFKGAGEFELYRRLLGMDFPEGAVIARDVADEYGRVLLKEGADYGPRAHRKLRWIEKEAGRRSPVLFELGPELTAKIQDGVRILFKLLLDRSTARGVFRGALESEPISIDDLMAPLEEDSDLLLIAAQLYVEEARLFGERQVSVFEHFFGQVLTAELGLRFVETFEGELPVPGGDRTLVHRVLINSFAGVWGVMPMLADLPRNKWQAAILTGRMAGLQSAKLRECESRVLKALELLGRWVRDGTPVPDRGDIPSAIARFLGASDMLARGINAGWGRYRPLVDAVDRLFVRARTQVLDRPVVDSLARGFQLQQLFEYYDELDYILDECPYICGIAYPTRNRHSATVILCRDNRMGCEHIRNGVTPVLVVDKVPEIETGEYSICDRLSGRLAELYRRHYRRIKDTALTERPGTGLSPEISGATAKDWSGSEGDPLAAMESDAEPHSQAAAPMSDADLLATEESDY